MQKNIRNTFEFWQNQVLTKLRPLRLLPVT